MIRRYFIGFVASGLVTAGLFYAMDFLIDVGEGVTVTARKGHVVHFIRLKPAKKMIRNSCTPRPPVPEAEAPPPLVQPARETVGGVSVAIDVAPPTMPAFSGAMLGVVGDADMIPVFKASPVYPPQAIRRGLEGHVIVEYTVLHNGITADVRVLEASNSVFRDAAIDAASRFRYKPRYVDGVAVAVAGVRSRIRFVLEN